MSSPGFKPETVDGRKLTQEQSDRLHFKKNKPDLPQLNGADIEFPPYVFCEFPKALYHASAGSRIVEDAEDERAFLSRGWRTTPFQAEDAAKAAEADRMVDAAVRAYDDQHMSMKAKAEIKAHEEATQDVVVDLPVKSKKEK